MNKPLILNRILFSVVLFCTSSMVVAKNVADSLRYYLEIAAMENPTILQKLNEYEAAVQKVPQVRSLSDPEFTAGVFLSPMELVSGNQIADIQLMQMFPWFGVLKNAKDEMSLMANAKYESFLDAKLQVLYEVQRIWYELYRVQQEIVISEKNMEILGVLERLTLIKYKTGSTTLVSTPNSRVSVSGTPDTSTPTAGMQSMSGNSGGGSVSLSGSSPSASVVSGGSMGTGAGGAGLVDLYRIQMEKGDLESSIASLKDQQRTWIATFNAYLNRSVTSPVQIPKKQIPESLDFMLSDSLLSTNPMLAMYQYEQKSLDAREKMVKRMGYPMIGVGLDYSLIQKNPMSNSSMNGKDMVMPMVKFTLPIYRKKYKAMQTESALLKSANNQGYKVAANSLQIDYYETIQLYQDAKRRMELYENQGKLTNQSLTILIKSFSTSGSGLTDILQMRQQSLDYDFKQVKAVVELNTAIAKLKRLIPISGI